jgi:hypothetical protein
MTAFLRQIGGRQIDGDALGGIARPEAFNAARTRSRDSATALSPRPTTVNTTLPLAICTCTSTGRASMPSNATVATLTTME